MPLTSVKEKGELSGSTGGKTVPAKRHFSSLEVVVVVDEEEEAGRKEPSHGVPASVDFS
jgi:hypothetical protein